MFWVHQQFLLRGLTEGAEPVGEEGSTLKPDRPAGHLLCNTQQQTDKDGRRSLMSARQEDFYLNNSYCQRLR